MRPRKLRFRMKTEVAQGPGGVNAFSPLLGPVLVWRHQNYGIAVDRDVFQVLLGLLLATLPEEKRV